MRLRGKFGLAVLLSVILLSAYAAGATAMGAAADQQNAQAGNSQIAGGSRDVNSSGAMRVDRDVEAAHSQDSNQYGDDEAYSSVKGRTNKESDAQAHHWNPESYGQMGSYGRDSK